MSRTRRIIAAIIATAALAAIPAGAIVTTAGASVTAAAPATHYYG